ncbi:hypothetical protein [Deinococcus radiophilus]|uniref:hypothetical protein n=1 Tax=Deinococcus radiophilus TaxID=32062 RepID=UPI003613F350
MPGSLNWTALWWVRPAAPSPGQPRAQLARPDRASHRDAGPGLTPVRSPGRGRARCSAGLLSQAVTTAQESGLVPALDVYAESQRAIALYERLGWQRRATYQGHWLWRGEYPTVHVYVAPLSANVQ